MMFGLAGSAGVGKTTLAKAIAADLDLTYMPTSITECAKKHGFDPVAFMGIGERLQLQEHLLEDHIQMIKEAPRPLIVDRTPIDMVGYLMCEFTMQSHQYATVEQIAQAEAYIHKALDAAVTYYDCIFMVSQLDTYQIADTRPADNRAYQSHSQLVMEGALSRVSHRLRTAIVTTTDPDRRVELVSEQIVTRMDAIEAMARTSPHFH
jgi:predicted ATPase